MIYSRKNQTLWKKRNMLKDMWNLKGTLDLLKEWKLTDNDACRVCESGAAETSAHHLFHCEDEHIQRLKNSSWNMMWEELDKQGEPWLPDLVGVILYGETNRIANDRIKEDLPLSWQQSHDKNMEERSDKEHAEAMAVELIQNMYHTQPIWKGIITTPMIKILQLGGIKPSKMKRTLKHYNDCLMVLRETMWTHRNGKTYTPEKEKEDVAYRKTIKRKTTGSKTTKKKRKSNTITNYLTKETAATDHTTDEHQETSRTTIEEIIPPRAKRTKYTSIISAFNRLISQTSTQRWRTLTNGLQKKELQKNLNKLRRRNKKRNTTAKQNRDLPIYKYMLMQSPKKRAKIPAPPSKQRQRPDRSRNVKELEKEKIEIEQRMDVRDDLHENTCYKCAEGGNLLVCEGCRKVAHEKCVEETVEQCWTCEDCQPQKNTLTIELERITKRITLVRSTVRWHSISPTWLMKVPLRTYFVRQLTAESPPYRITHY